jgi:hypothetical protein
MLFTFIYDFQVVWPGKKSDTIAPLNHHTFSSSSPAKDNAYLTLPLIGRPQSATKLDQVTDFHKISRALQYQIPSLHP